MESSKDKSLLELLDRIFSVVFCGCPHRGADAAAWGSLLSKIATVVLAAPTVQLLSHVEIDSKILGMIQDDFSRTLQYHPSIRVHSFLEGRGMTGIKDLGGKVSPHYLCYVLTLTECIRSLMTSLERLAG
jgi:hypothetical protein